MSDPVLLSELRLRLKYGPKRRRRIARAPRWLHPDTAYRNYLRKLLAVIEIVRQAARENIFTRLPEMVAEAQRLRGDSWTDDLERLTAQIRFKVENTGPEPEETAKLVGVEVSQYNLEQWRRITLSTVGVELFSTEPWLKDMVGGWAGENAALIRSLEAEAVKDVELWTSRAIREGQRHEQVQQLIEERFGVAESRARLIARDQVSKLNGDLTKERQTRSGVTEYRWRTSLDERVRGLPSGKYPDADPRHDVLEGKYCSWDDPTIYKDSPDGEWKARSDINAVELHPGEDYQDRCTAEPVMAGLLEAIAE